MTVPQSCIEILRMRLTNSAFQRAVGLAATFTGEEARAGGWLDEVVAPEDVLSRAQEVAAGFAATLHTQHHLASKLKARADGLADPGRHRRPGHRVRRSSLHIDNYAVGAPT